MGWMWGRDLNLWMMEQTQWLLDSGSKNGCGTCAGLHSSSRECICKTHDEAENWVICDHNSCHWKCAFGKPGCMRNFKLWSRRWWARKQLWQKSKHSFEGMQNHEVSSEPDHRHWESGIAWHVEALIVGVRSCLGIERAQRKIGGIVPGCWQLPLAHTSLPTVLKYPLGRALSPLFPKSTPVFRVFATSNT